MSKTLTKSKIIEKLHNSIGLSRAESSEFLESFLLKILNSLKTTKIVKIANFGSFSVKKKNPRIGRNPKTMKEVLISERKVVKFKPSNYLINKINKS